MHWSYVFLALTHCYLFPWCWLCNAYPVCISWTVFWKSSFLHRVIQGQYHSKWCPCSLKSTSVASSDYINKWVLTYCKHNWLVTITDWNFLWFECGCLSSYFLLKLSSWISLPSSGINVCMCPANERWRDKVTSSLIGWAHAQIDPCMFIWGEMS